jgi:hypothetical protein
MMTRDNHMNLRIMISIRSARLGINTFMKEQPEQVDIMMPDANPRPAAFSVSIYTTLSEEMKRTMFLLPTSA